MSRYAPDLFRSLNGVFCIYKPQGMSLPRLLNAMKLNLSNELNACELRPPRKIIHYSDERTEHNLPVITTVPDLADHPLVVGPRYIPDDFILDSAHSLSSFSSGVTLMGIGYQRRMLFHIRNMQLIRVYHISGELGTATLDFSSEGKLMQRTTYHHVTQAKIDKTIAAVQAGHQKHMYLAAGVDLQSQEAYDLAVKGLVRPKDVKAGTVIYNMKCIHFKPPHFTLEVHAINETSAYMMKLIHELGLEMKTTAMCTQLRRIRYGHFALSHSLLRKHWDAQSIIDNIEACNRILSGRELRHSHLIESVETASLTPALPA